MTTVERNDNIKKIQSLSESWWLKIFPLLDLVEWKRILSRLAAVFISHCLEKGISKLWTPRSNCFNIRLFEQQKGTRPLFQTTGEGLLASTFFSFRFLCVEKRWMINALAVLICLLYPSGDFKVNPNIFLILLALLLASLPSSVCAAFVDDVWAEGSSTSCSPSAERERY